METSGIFDFHQVMRNGYPIRIDYAEIYKKHHDALISKNINIDAKGLCNILLRRFGCKIGTYIFGSSKVMLKSCNETITDRLSNAIEQNVYTVAYAMDARMRWKRAFAICLYFNSKIKKIIEKPSKSTEPLSFNRKRTSMNDFTSKTVAPVKPKITTKSKKPNQMEIDNSRYDKYDHWPKKDNKKSQSRCKMENCGEKTHIYCSKCQLHLCITSSRNCFVDYHIR